MWEIPFDESMLSENLIIHCAEESLANELMELLEQNGIVWSEGSAPTSSSNWGHYQRETCYWVESWFLSYGDLDCAEENPDGEYTNYIKCTFYGKDEQTFEPANDSEMQGFLGF